LSSTSFNWVESYYKNLKSRLGIDPENLAPRLLDEHIPKLTSDYVKLVHEKVVEWTNNMLHIESADFKASFHFHMDYRQNKLIFFGGVLFSFFKKK